MIFVKNLGNYQCQGMEPTKKPQWALAILSSQTSTKGAMNICAEYNTLGDAISKNGDGEFVLSQRGNAVKYS